jgi:hypothetical protein
VDGADAAIDVRDAAMATAVLLVARRHGELRGVEAGDVMHGPPSCCSVIVDSLIVESVNLKAY